MRTLLIGSNQFSVTTRMKEITKQMLHAIAGETQEQNNPMAALKPYVGSCGSPTPGTLMTCLESFSPMVSEPGSITNSLAISHDSAHSKQLSPVDAAADSIGPAKELDLLTDTPDGFMPSDDGVQDNYAMCEDLFLGSHHDLPDDPLEGLCIPSWQDLLNEAVSEFNPQETPRGDPPGNASGMPNAYQAAQESPEGCSWGFPALSEEGPAQKRLKTGDSGRAQGSTTSLSWDHLQDHPQEQCQLLTAPERSAARNMAESRRVVKSDFAMQPADDQARSHTSSGKHGTQSDKLNQEAQQTMIETSSAGDGAQHAQHQPKPAAVQKRRVGAAKRAKRGLAGGKGQGKRAAARQGQGKGNTLVSGQGEGQRPQGASLGKVLPFDSLKVRASAVSKAVQVCKDSLFWHDLLCTGRITPSAHP